MIRSKLWETINGLCACGTDCARGGKHPKTGVARPDEPHAVWTGGGLLVVDVDVKNGKDGFRALQDVGFNLPDTFTVRTLNNGKHFYYSYNPDIHVGCPVPWGPKAGVEVKGEGGYVVGAPPYTVERNILVAPAPAYMLGKFQTRVDCTHRPVALDPSEPRYPIHMAWCAAALQDCEPAISGQGGHNALFHAAQLVTRRYQIPPDAGLELLKTFFNPRCQPPWSDKDISHKLQQALEKGTMEIGPWEWTLGPWKWQKFWKPRNRQRMDTDYVLRTRRHSA